jgi:hypothetical protein
MPSLVTRIEPLTFYGCSTLRRLNFSANLQQIEANALDNCYALKQITIPGDAVNIEQEACNGCSFDTITFEGNDITIVADLDTDLEAFIKAEEIILTRYNPDNKGEFLVHFRPPTAGATARAEFLAAGEHWEYSQGRWHKLEEEAEADGD